MLIADSIPRYKEPSFDELVDDLTPEQVMQNCVHCVPCIRMIERFTGDDYTVISDAKWRHLASVAGCADCLECE